MEVLFEEIEYALNFCRLCLSEDTLPDEIVTPEAVETMLKVTVSSPFSNNDQLRETITISYFISVAPITGGPAIPLC